jgi:hypothetical protein
MCLKSNITDYFMHDFNSTSLIDECVDGAYLFYFCTLYLVQLMQWKATRRIIQRIVGTRSDLGGLERL